MENSFAVRSYFPFMMVAESHVRFVGVGGIVMKVTIIGAGNTAAAAACHMLSKGLDVTVYARNIEKAALWKKTAIEAKGRISGTFRIPVTPDIKEAVSGADVLVFATLANQHRAAAEDVMPYLEKGQVLLVLNGCWGALQMGRVLGDKWEKLALTIGETANMPYIASLAPDWKTVTVKGLKEAVSFAAAGPGKEKIRELLELLGFSVREEPSLAVTSLGSTNPIIHVAASLFNVTRIDNGEDFLFFGAPMTEKTVAVMEKMDAERLAVGRALGCALPSLLDGLNSFWPEKWPTLYEALTKNASYKVSKGPTSLSYRYLSEDLPCGLEAVADLGKLLGVPVPATETVIRAASLYLGKPVVPFLQREDLKLLRTLG